jgi:hypothetical protein
LILLSLFKSLKASSIPISAEFVDLPTAYLTTKLEISEDKAPPVAELSE